MSRSKKLATLAFSRDRKRMSVLCKDHTGNDNILYVKGAPDYILSDCDQALNAKGEVENLSSQARNIISEQIK